MRTDGLPDLGEEFVFLSSPLRLMHDDIVFQCQRNLQCQPDEQLQIRRAERVPFRMWKQNDPEVMLPRLQAHRHQVSDSLRQQQLLADRKLSSRKRRQRLFQFGEVAKRDHSTTAVGEFGDVIPSLRLMQLFQKLRGETFLYRRHGAAPLLGNKKDGATRRQGRH